MGAQAFVPRSIAPSSAPPHRHRTRGAEAGALLLFAAALFVAVALLTARFDPSDPSLHGDDWMGAVGASVASLMIQAFGAAAWLLPLELLCMGLPLLQGRVPEQLGLRVAGDLMISILVASLLQVALPDALVFGAGLPGGNVGLFFGELMRGLFSAPGSFLVACTGVALILIGRATFSFIEFCERVARLYAAVLRQLAACHARLFSAWQKARALRAEQERLVDSEPVIDEPSAEAVLFHQWNDDHAWVPQEVTGCPPLSIVDSLRRNSLSELQLEMSGDETRATAPALSRAPVTEPTNGFWTGLTDGFGTSSDAVFDTSTSRDLRQATLSPSEGTLPEPATVGENPHTAATACAPPLPLMAPELARADQGGTQVLIVDTKPQQETRPAVARARPRQTGNFELPATELLEAKSGDERAVDKDQLLRHASQLEKTLLDYGVVGQVEEIHPGPTVTTFEFSPSAGTKVSKVAGLADDLALGLSRKVRIIAPIPGKNRIGFELPNDERVPVNLRELIEDERFLALTKKVPLPVVLGRDIVGAPFYADLASMPHVIVAGATGAGKSVGLNVMLSSLLFCRSPDELRMLMIDPKVVELAPFDRIPHLLLPVVTDMKQAATALRWAVDEMERRYQLFADAGTKNITTYNRYADRVRAGEIPALRPKNVEGIGFDGETVMLPASKEGGDGVEMPEKMPFIVIVVDEFADLMMQQGKEVEISVARLAQKARAAGMHVILATQRPSVDVITGMIKANFPTRIAFRVAQKVDSRTILDEQGAEVLLGRGDMLVKLNGANETLRVQCPFVSEEEVDALTAHLRAQGAPRYQESILEEPEADEADLPEDKGDSRFEEAVLIVRETQRCSTSWLQRKMTVGYNRAAKIVEMMERRGYVGPPNGSKDREVFIPPG